MPSKPRSSSAFARFFQNEKGEWVLYQHPNLLLGLWIVVQLLSFFMKDIKALAVFASMLLFAWAYNELRQGESSFRRVLGAGILAILLINVFMKWQ